MRRLILPILAGLAMVLVNAQGTKADLLSAEVTQVWTFPRIELAERSPKTAKVYSGSGGYNVAGRIEGDKVYSGSSGFNVVGRIEGNKIYSGSSGYNVAGRVDGKKVYAGSSGYNVVFRGEGDKVYAGNSGYNVVFRGEGCALEKLLLAALVL